MKQTNIKFRCTKEFKLQVKALAKQCNMAVSEYLLMLVYKDMGGNK